MAVGSTVYGSMADTAATKYGVPTGIFRSLIGTESSWNQNSISGSGAIGLTQLMPGTAQELGVNPYDAQSNLNGGASYLAKMYKKFGNWRDALAAYNAGGGNIGAGYGYADTVLANSGYSGTDASGTADQPARGDTSPSTGGNSGSWWSNLMPSFSYDKNGTVPGGGLFSITKPDGTTTSYGKTWKDWLDQITIPNSVVFIIGLLLVAAGVWALSKPSLSVSKNVMGLKNA